MRRDFAPNFCIAQSIDFIGLDFRCNNLADRVKTAAD
jgi:hypothetical protein